MVVNPWLSGCMELLEHGIKHFLNDTEYDRREAMICIDNALELAIKTYISRNLRVLNIKRKDFNNLKQDFSKLLNLILKVIPDKISEIELSSIEHNHNLRNNLYHEGIGISINKEIVKSYGKESISLISKLYDVDLSNLIKRLEIERFIEKLKTLEKEWSRINLLILMFRLDFDLEIGELTVKERISELSSKNIISLNQKNTLLEILAFLDMMKSKTSKISFQELEKIDYFITKAKETNVFLSSIAEEKKKERRSKWERGNEFTNFNK